MKQFLIKTEDQSIVEYTYVVEGDSEYDAIQNFIIKSGYLPVDHTVIADKKTLKIRVVKEIIEEKV